MIADFFRITVLSVNVNKTKFMRLRSLNIGSNSSTETLYMKTEPMEEVRTMKYIGLTIDQNLTFYQHIEVLSKEISKPVGIMFKLKRRLNNDTLLRIYHSLVQSKFSYMLGIWTSAKETDLHPSE